MFYQPPYFYFSHVDHNTEKEYKKGFSIREMFPTNGTGIVTSRDAFVINDNMPSLTKQIEDFCDQDLSHDDFQSLYNLKENYQWKVKEQRGLVPPYDNK